MKRKLDEEVQKVIHRCQLPNCDSVEFYDFFQYETHLSRVHDIHQETSECETCWKRFPSEQFLEAHLNECHNPFVEIRRERGEATYKCLSCSEMFIEFNERNMHMVEHGYPKDYPFEVIRLGLQS